MSLPRLPLVALALMVAGCSSAAVPDAAAGGGDAGGRDGAEPGRDAATERPGNTDASRADGAGPELTAMQACREAIRVQYERIARCTGAASDPLWFANLCPDYYFNPDSNRTIAEVAACLTALADQPCTDLVLGLRPSCLNGGKRPAGANCDFSSQCQSGSCSTHGGSCDTCDDSPVPLGGQCSGKACERGTFCHRKTLVCTDASTIVRAAEGQPCDFAASPVVGCVGDLACITGTSSSTTGVCSRGPAADQPCATSLYINTICAPGAQCTKPSGGVCQVPGSCGNTTCDANSYCKAGSSPSCAPRATLGQPCGDPSTTSLVPCVSPASCRDGACKIVRALGEPCDANNPCSSWLQCTSGLCQAAACGA